MKLAITYLAVAVGNIVFFTSLYILFPTLRDNLVQEDKFLENLTALVFFQGFIVGMIGLYKFKKLPNKKLYILIPLISLLGFLDELSFGERIVNFQAPVIAGQKIDAAHDFFNLFYKVGYKKIVYPQFVEPLTEILLNNAFILFLLAICLLGVIFKYRKLLFIYLASLWSKLQDLFGNKWWANLPLKFSLVALIFLFISTGIELRLFGKLPERQFIEELSEVNMAIGFLFASLSLWYGSRIFKN